jgi:hypothetical protein
MRADRLPARGMFIVPHGAPGGYEWFVALVVLVGLCFAVCSFMRNAKPLDGLRRERQGLPALNPIRPGPGPEHRLRELQRRFRAVSPAIGESAPASETLSPTTAILAFAVVVWGLSLLFGGASRAEVKMSWHNPDLYFFLGLLTGLAAFLAIIYECIQRFRRRKAPVVLPLDGLQRDHPARPTEERASRRPSDFSRLCESMKDAPPNEQASRVREHF